MTVMPFPLRLQEVAADLAGDTSTPRAVATLRRRHAPLASTDEQLRMLAAAPLQRNGRPVEFDAFVGGALKPARLEIFQVNLGKLCNMTCRHCHVDAAPWRTDFTNSGWSTRNASRSTNRAHRTMWRLRLVDTTPGWTAFAVLLVPSNRFASPFANSRFANFDWP